MDELNNGQQPIQQPVQPVQAAPIPGEDLSKTTIAVLVLLTLMISVIGTWTVLNEISTVKMTTQQQKPASSTGQVQLNIQGGTHPAPLSETTGRVSLIIK